MKTARIFPRRTTATPDDPLAFVGGPGLFPPDVDEVHISVSFREDLPLVERLEKDWRGIAPVKIGGPALGDIGGDFVPGRYLKKGYVITSRGCPNKCWFCDVWKRDGDVRELPITSGWIVQDDNLLACSREHIKKVFAMLKGQKEPVELRGMEAARVDPWVADELWKLKPKQMFFAYDEPADLEPLVEAGKLLRFADFTRSHLRCYVLIGHKGDTLEAAHGRLLQAWSAGFMPCAMLYDVHKQTKPWRDLQKSWMRPASIRAVMRSTCKKFYNITK